MLNQAIYIIYWSCDESCDMYKVQHDTNRPKYNYLSLTTIMKTLSATQTNQILSLLDLNQSHIKSLQLLVYTTPILANYALNFIPLFPSPLVVVPLSFPLPICNMPFVLSVLARLILQSKSSKPSRTSRTSLSLSKPSAIISNRLVWKLWWRRNTLYFWNDISTNGWTLQSHIRTKLWRTGSMLYDQMRPRLIVWGQMGGNGSGKGWERVSVAG